MGSGAAVRHADAARGSEGRPGSRPGRRGVGFGAPGRDRVRVRCAPAVAVPDQVAVVVSRNPDDPVSLSRRQVENLHRSRTRCDVTDEHDAVRGGHVRFVAGMASSAGSTPWMPERTAARSTRFGMGPLPAEVTLPGLGVRPSRSRSVHPSASASASTSARCRPRRPRRPASCSTCVRQEKPSARITVSSVASRTAGSSCSSAQAAETA